MFLNDIHFPSQNTEPNSVLLPDGLTYSQKILSVGQPLFWHRADMDVYQTVGGSVAGNGDPVGSWLDQSINDRDVSSTTTARPVMRTGEVNGLPALEFDGSNDVLDFAANLTDSTMTFFAVMKHTINPGTTFETALNTQKICFLLRGGALNQLGLYLNADRLSNLSLATDYAIVTYVVRNFNSFDVRLNGISETVTSGTVFNNIAFTRYGAVVASFGHMKLAEGIGFAGALSVSQINIIETALSGRYAIPIAPFNGGLMVAGDSKMMTQFDFVPQLISNLIAVGQKYMLHRRDDLNGQDVAGLRTRLTSIPPNPNVPITDILINIGINNISDGALADVTADLTWIVETLHTAYPSARIFIMRVGRDATGHPTWPAKLTTLNDTYIANVISAHASYCFAGPDERVWMEGGDNYATYTDDGVHPNAAGRIVSATQWQTSMGY